MADHMRGVGTGTVHGGLPMAELDGLGIAPGDVLDLSASLNPYGPSDAVLSAVRAAPLDRYPDPGSHAAKRSLAEVLDRDPAGIVLGHGACELLWALTEILGARARRPVVIAEPAFGEVRAAAAVRDVRVLAVQATRRADGFAHDLDGLREQARKHEAAFVYVCNPSTPDGALTRAYVLAAWARELGGCPLVLDESFLSLSDHHADAGVPMPDNVLRIRSLTKEQALPGVRIGYGLMPPALVARIERGRPPWTISAAAQAVAQTAPREHAFLADSRARIASDRAALRADLRAFGLSPWRSVAPYLAFPVRDARPLRDRLLREHHVLVRECSSFGLPDTVRVAVRPRAERERLIAALSAVLGRG